MSIERSGAPAGQKTVGSADGHHAKAKSPAPGEADASASGGFMSLLNAIEADTGTDAGADTLVLASAMPETPLALIQAEPAIQLVPSGLAGQASSEQAPMAPSDLEMLLASQSMAAGGAVADLSRPGPVAAGEAAATQAVVGSALANGTRGGGVSSVKGAEGQAGANQALQLVQSGEVKNPVQILDEITPKAAKTAVAGVAKNSVGEAQLGTAKAAPDWRDLKPIYVTDTTSLSAERSEVLVAAAGMEGGFRQTERATEKAISKQVGGVTDGVWGPQALFAGARVDAPSAMVNAALPSPELLVAEQVSYWISSDVQKAELKLDGLGPDPVEVSISLQGKEARVEFRTDQAATRDVLENAVPHLKELLKNEGLVLSGVSVGTSGQQEGQGSQERRPRSGMRQMNVVTPQAVSTPGSQGGGRHAGRAVDLFV